MKCYLLALLIGLTATAPALAERADRDAPTNISAVGSMNRNDLERISTVIGNALLTKGTLRIDAEKIEVREDPEGYQYAVATALPGQLVKFRQKREGVDEYISGQAVRIEYDGKNETVRFIQQATVWRLICDKPTDESRGELITYDQRTELYSVAPTAQGGAAPASATTATAGRRVSAIIQPKARDAAGKVLPTKCPTGTPQQLKPTKDGLTQ